MKSNSLSDIKKELKELDKNQLMELCLRLAKYKVDNKGLNLSKTLIKQTLKAEIARQLWTEDGFYSVVNQFDKEVQRALK